MTSLDKFLAPVNTVPVAEPWPKIDGDISHMLGVDPEPRKWERPSDHAPVMAEFKLT